MRDLYKRAGIRARADISEVERVSRERAIPDPWTRDAVAGVLLNPNRKATYDRAHAVLTTIGQLRSDFGLSRSESWISSACTDFDPATSATPREHAVTPARRHATSRRTTNRSDRFLMALGCLVTAGIAVAIPTAWMLLEASASRSVTPTPKGRAVAERSPELARSSPAPIAAVAPRPVADDWHARIAARLSVEELTATPEIVETLVAKARTGAPNPRPVTGVMSSEHGGPAVAPLRVETSLGRDYFIKLIPVGSQRATMRAYIRGGETLSTSVATGSYLIRYACGRSWFGTILDFGRTAEGYFVCDERFDFTETPGGVSGYTLELIVQSGGNLDTDPIPASAF